MSRDKILYDSWSISRGVKWCVPGSSLGRHLESGVDPGNEVDERALNDNINYAQKGCAMQL